MGDYKVIVNFEKCTGCGECVSVCPSEVYEGPVNGKTVVAKEDDCIGCRACESGCPEGAIEIQEK